MSCMLRNQHTELMMRFFKGGDGTFESWPNNLITHASTNPADTDKNGGEIQ